MVCILNICVRAAVRTAVQRAVAKFTRSRSNLLCGEKEAANLSDKQKTQLQALFDARIYHVFLPRSQCVAPPSWMAKHVRTTDAGGKEVTCKRGRPQLFSIKFTADLTDGQTDYINGGKFSLTGPNIAESPIRCVALKLTGEDGEEGAPQWRLENYDEVEDEDSQGEAEEDELLSESSEEDALQAPRGHELGYRSGSDMEACFDDWEDLQEEDEGVEMWRGSPDNKPPMQTGTAEMETGTSSPIHRPRAKHESAEWKRLEEEGWFKELPQIPGTTLSRHNQICAWSSRYPTPAGMRHCARHFNESKSAFVALLECVAWMVSQHFQYGGKDDAVAALHQRLLARIAMEDCVCEFYDFLRHPEHGCHD